MSRRMSFSEDREYLLTVIKLENEELFSLVASVATICKSSSGVEKIRTDI